MTTTRPDLNVTDPLDAIQVLESVRGRLRDVEALVSAAGGIELPHLGDPDERRDLGRLQSFVSLAQNHTEAAIGEIEAALAAALDLTPIPGEDRATR